MIWRRFFVVGVFLLMPGGCTLAPGDWFMNLRPTFEGRYASVPDRDVGAGWQRLNTLYQVRMSRAQIVVQDILLQETGGNSDTAGFDPANPPAGYSLCHNGHCHRGDGALIPYDQIAAEISGAGASAPRTVVTLPVGDADLLIPIGRTLNCQPGCGIAEANIRRARATVTGVVFEGLVRDGKSPPRLEGEVPWRWDATATLGAVTFDCAAELPADNAHPPNVDLGFTLQASARLLDDIEWMSLTRDLTVIDFSATPNTAARDQLRENLAESALTTIIHRTE